MPGVISCLQALRRNLASGKPDYTELHAARQQLLEMGFDVPDEWLTIRPSLPILPEWEAVRRVCQEIEVAIWRYRAAGKRERTPDSKTDNQENLVPENPDVCKLAKEIKRKYKKRGYPTKKSVAIEFTKGDDAKAETLLRELRRFPDLLKADN